MEKRINLVKIVLAIVLLIPLIFWVIEIKNYIQDKDTLKNGIITEATVYDASNDETINGVPKYSLLYAFEDENGINHEGKTSCDYSYYDYEEIIENGRKISIIYDPNTFNSIQSDYDGKPSFIIYILPIFGVISIFLIISSIISFINTSNDKKVISQGNMTKGTIISTRSMGLYNHVQYFSVKYCFKDNQGIQHECTNHKKFTYEEIEQLKQQEYLDIAYLGKKSTIVFEKDLSKNSKFEGMAPQSNFSMAPQNNLNYNDNTHYEQKPYIKKKCEYCGQYLPDGELICPSCGAKNFAD